ncbi:hypothetical protein VIGAN_04145500 [Vigna angularis var. angularis]|uniref:Uncharacterized protein n=1 Tax=Vigna angularis var. angularis TaxID=157739 RepID=A0A0S3RUB1_PHAAN|nr:hypothetical protein VIGAN_04145500 [Vigna angularis var. angularis]
MKAIKPNFFYPSVRKHILPIFLTLHLSPKPLPLSQNFRLLDLRPSQSYCSPRSSSFFLPSLIFSSHSFLSFPLSIDHFPFLFQICSRRTLGRRSNGCVD